MFGILSYGEVHGLVRLGRPQPWTLEGTSHQITAPKILKCKKVCTQVSLEGQEGNKYSGDPTWLGRDLDQKLNSPPRLLPSYSETSSFTYYILLSAASSSSHLLFLYSLSQLVIPKEVS